MSKLTAPRRHDLTGAGEVSLAADVAGLKDAPPVLLLHGGGQTRHSWRKALVELAAAGYQTVAFDARGHGDSQWPTDGDYSLGALCADLRKVVDTLGTTPPALIGASLGGITSIVTAAQHPGLASALVLVDVVPRLEMEGVTAIHTFMSAHPDGFDSLEAAAESVANFNRYRREVPNPQGLRKNLRQGDDGRWRWHWDPRVIAGTLADHLPRLSQAMREAARNIHIPCLLLRGQQSDVVSMEGVREMQVLLPQLEFVNIDSAGHMVAGDRNDAFNAAIIQFLGRVYPPASC